MKKGRSLPVLIWAGLAVHLSWLSLAGCTSPQASRHPTVATTTITIPTTAVVPTGLVRAVQERLFQRGRTLFAAHRYGEAVKVFRHLIETHPRTPLLEETHWWLGQAYEGDGRWDEALAEYRILTRLAPITEGARWREAGSRIRELEQQFHRERRRMGPVVGVLIPASRLPEAAELASWIQSLQRGGITTLLLEIGTAFKEILPIAHREGLQVFASMAPRRMDLVAPRLEWYDRSLDDTGHRLRPSRYLDLFHPGLQEYLKGFMQDLAKSGIDGILFRNDAPLGPRDGFSSYALQGFQQDFGKPLVPSQLFVQTNGVASGSVYAPEFWRWAGWKSRERVKVLAGLARIMRQQAPGLQVALEIHSESLSDPVTALAQFSEDLLEAKRQGFGLFLIDPSRAASMPGRGADGLGGPLFTERVREMVGEPHAIWISMPLPTGDVARLGERLTLDVNHAVPVQGMGLIYLDNSSLDNFPPIPE